MPCKAHEIFYPACGHVFRCEESHSSLPSHPCNKYLPRTISWAERSPIGSWRMCPECQGGPKLHGDFKLQEFSHAGAFCEWDWDKELGDLKNYYDRHMRNDVLAEWCLEDKLGKDWEVVPEGMYKWEKDEGKKKGCRERTGSQLPDDE